MQKRIYELDFLRGIGLSFVVLYHTLVDLVEFYNMDIPLYYFLSKYCVYSFTSIIILVSGASAFLGKSTAKRGFILILIGYLITALTYFFVSKTTFVTFGILQLLGFSMVISAVIKHYKLSALHICIGSGLIIALGLWFNTFSIKLPFLYPLGLTTAAYTSLDHYPLLPWTGVFLLGFCFSMQYYKERVSPFTSNYYSNNIITKIGRQALWVYLLHQPIILGLLWLIFR